MLGVQFRWQRPTNKPNVVLSTHGMPNHSMALSVSTHAFLLMKGLLKEFLVYISELSAQTQFSFTFDKDMIHI